MSMSLVIEFGKPVDEKYVDYAEVWQACEKAGVEIPQDVLDFFYGVKPDGNALWLNKSNISDEVFVKDTYYEKMIDLRCLPKDVRLIRISLG